jgi:hypothetical protein
MTPSSNLFDIIHSLTASEKRYFKVFSSTHGSKSNYEKLFDAYLELPANEPYDEIAFKKKLARKKWKINLAWEKKFLEDMLMKAMRAYNAEKSAEGTLNDIIANVNFLYNKGLINAASKELKKGIALGEELENLPGLIILYQLKLNLTRITQTPADLKTADEDLEAETRILKMLDSERKVVHAGRKVYNLYRGGQLKKNIAGAKMMIAELEVLESGQPLSYKSRMSLFFIRAMVAEKAGRFVDAMKQYELANAIWKKSELKLHESYSNLRTILNNYLACAHQAGMFDVYPKIIEQIEGFPVENIKDQADSFVVAKGSRLIYLLNTPNKNGSEHLIKEIEAGLKKFHPQITRHQTININTNICFLHFQTRNYLGLIDALNNTFALIGRDEKMHQLLHDLKFLEIMAHFSLRNFDLLEYQLRNTERWLREHQLNQPFTDLLLKSFPAMRTQPQYSKIKNQLLEIACPGDLQSLKSLVFEWMEVNVPKKSNYGQVA